MDSGRAAEQLCILGPAVHTPVLQGQPTVAVFALWAHRGTIPPHPKACTPRKLKQISAGAGRISEVTDPSILFSPRGSLVLEPKIMSALFRDREQSPMSFLHG